MTAENRTKKGKATLDSVLSTVERGFAAVADDITDIKSKMATKDDIGRLDKKIDSVESSLAGEINRLDTKLTKFEEHEIDRRLQLVRNRKTSRPQQKDRRQTDVTTQLFRCLR
jgi:hypothetical protein